VSGRPSLRIGDHGEISRKCLGGGVWLARCRYRDTDGVTRKVQRIGPPDEFDQHWKLAEDALIEALAERRPPPDSDAIGLDTLVMSLVDQHISRLSEDGRSVMTLDTYRYDAGKLAKVIAGVRVGEGSRARIDAALRIRTAHGATGADTAAGRPSDRRAEQRPRYEPAPLRSNDQVQGPAEVSRGPDSRPVARPATQTPHRRVRRVGGAATDSTN
jgi:hypothetical protein